MKENQPYYAVVTLVEGIALDAGFRKPLLGGIRGMLPQPPKIGERFFMYLDGAERYLRTSVVQNLREEKNGTVHIQTKHSIYVLSNIEEARP